MSSVIILFCLKLCPLALALGHAYFEARAAHRYAGPVDAAPRFSLLWLVSATAFFLYELAAIYAALSLPAPSQLATAGCIAGAALFAYGVLFRLAAIQQLQTAFNRPPWSASDAGIEHAGVFAMVRHPSEFGLFLMCAGLALAAGSPAVFAICGLVLLPLMALRIAEEEAWLTHATGGAYTRYAAAVPCFFPSLRLFRA